MGKPSFWMASLIFIGDKDFYQAQNPGYCRPRMFILAHLLLNFLLGSNGLITAVERTLSIKHRAP